MKSFELFLEEKANKSTYEFLLHEIALEVVKDKVCFEQLLNEVGWNPFSRPVQNHDDINTATAAIQNLIRAQKSYMRNNPQVRGYYAPKIAELNKIASYLKSGLNGDLASQFFDPWQAYAAHQMTGYEYSPRDFVPRNRQQQYPSRPLNQGKRFGRTPGRGFVDSTVKKSRGNPYANQNVPGSGTVNTNTYQNPQQQSTVTPGSGTVNTSQANQNTSSTYGTSKTMYVDPNGTTSTIDPSQWPNNVNPTYSPGPVNPNVNVSTAPSYSPEEEEARRLQLQKAYGESFLEWFKRKSTENPI